MGLILKTQGAELSGSITGHFGDHSFTGGQVDGNAMTLSITLQSPMGPMQLDVKATVNGETLTGEVQLGSFRPTPLKGRRV